MLPAPKKAQQPADDEAGGMRMLGQGAGDGSLSHVSLARPLSRKARDTAGPSSNSSSSKKEATQPPKRQRLADDEDDIDPDSYFTLDVDGLGSSSKPQAPAAAPLAASAGSDDVGGSSVVADYAVYAAQFAAQGGPVPTTGRDEEQPYAADYGAYAAAYASQYGIAYGAEQADAYPDDEDGDNVDEYGGLDPQALLKLGHRPKKDGAVAIKDIRGSEQVGEARQLFNQKQASLQGLSGTSFQRLGSGVVSMGMKRRHNIMSLAYEARARQQSLEEQAANRRAMQKVTRAKYGF
ncbi:hypothetical protein HK105_208389 [Polyrhizophydium stewartii]|uniref:Proline-rich protein PRCC n=1 Tax=Polyrhizophydium stewartii TaxID=2732419 RepID=A0ABR4MXX5_9FUNG|nr:hypothetical protein HK105_007662 [Polyrhizophydium stewartii]